MLDEQKDELAKTLTSEMGKPLQQSYNELNGARNRIKFFIDNSAKWLADEWITTEGATKEKISYEPLGYHCQYFCLELSLPRWSKCIYSRIDRWQCCFL